MRSNEKASSAGAYSYLIMHSLILSAFEGHFHLEEGIRKKDTCQSSSAKIHPPFHGLCFPRCIELHQIGDSHNTQNKNQCALFKEMS